MMVKYFFLKGHGSKLIHRELVSTLQNNAISLSTFKNWLKRFLSGDLSRGDEERSGGPLISLGPAFQRFLEEFPFASARVRTGNFSVDRATIKSSLDRELGLRKFTRRWMLHILSAEEKLRRVTESQRLLTILVNFAEKNFQGIITGDESWFGYFIESDAMFASSPAEVTPRASHQVPAKSYDYIFLHGKRPTDFGCPTERIQIQPRLFY
jgi:hypothetical protein